MMQFIEDHWPTIAMILVILLWLMFAIPIAALLEHVVGMFPKDKR